LLRMLPKILVLTVLIPLASVAIVFTGAAALSARTAQQAPVVINVAESISVSDAVQALPPVVINVAESISVSDAPQAVPPASISVSESISVADSVQVVAVVVQLTVNSTADAVDASPGDSVCQTSTANECTLRAAIMEANALAGPEIITFSIPVATDSGCNDVTGVCTIQPASALPAITGLVTIDGYTQPGAIPNTNGPGFGLNTVLKIELDGISAGVVAAGLDIAAGNITIRGLAINRFTGDGIRLISGSNVIEGNFIGTDASGTLDLGNSDDGVEINGGVSNIIGGVTPAAANVISGNGKAGVFIIHVAATGNLVRGNLIGTDITGTLALGNTSSGVFITFDASNNTIGGTASAAGNTIAFNNRGVFVFSGTDNAILSNSIFSNSGLGIELDGASQGVTPNDLADPDTGANNRQNFPVLNTAVSDVGTTIDGALNSSATTIFRLEFFSNTTCDSSGNGEGESFLGSTTVTTDINGNGTFIASLSATAPVGHFITATATDPNGNTSEFSECIGAVPPPPPAATIAVPTGIEITVASSGQAPVNALNTPSLDLGAYQFELSYDPTVVTVTGVLGGTVPFDDVTGVNNATPGLVVWNDFQGGQVAVTADHNLANVQLQAAVGAQVNGCSPLTLTVIELVDNQAAAIPNITQNGEVCLVGVVGNLAETDLRAGVDIDDAPPNRATGVVPSIDLVKDAGGNLPGTLIASYAAQVAFPFSLAEATVCENKPPLNVSTTCVIGAGIALGKVNLAGSGNPPAEVPINRLAFVGLRLTGPNTSPVNVTLTFTDIKDSLGSTIAQDTPDSRTFLRGDARADGSISVSDALFIAQHLVDPAARPAGEGAGEIHPVNAGSVVHDLVGGVAGTGIDVITVADVVRIAQFLVGNADGSYFLN